MSRRLPYEITQPNKAPLPYTVTFPEDQIVLHEKAPRLPLEITSGKQPPSSAYIGALGQLAQVYGPVVYEWGKKQALQVYKNMVKRKQNKRGPIRSVNQIVVPRQSIPQTIAATSRGKNASRAVRIQGQTTQNTYAPVAISTRIGTRKSKPRVQNLRDGTIVVSHSEMVGTLVSSGTTNTYKVESYVANPGKPAIFPWLSTISTNYDKYRFRRLSVCLVSSQPTSTAGRIGIGFDYDSTDPTPANRIEFFALTSHVEATPWQSIELDIPVEGGLRFTNTHTTTDSKLIDLGQVLLMSDQIVATGAVLADVIVSYEVELHHPQQAIFNTQSFISVLDSGASSQGPAFIVQTPRTATLTDFLIPQGSWEITVKLVGVALAAPTANNVFDFFGTAGVTSTACINTALTLIIQVTRFENNNPSFTASFDSTRFGGVALSTLTGIRIFFSRVSPRLANGS